MHEEAEDGNAMPDLEQPVKVVSNAVSNLVKVGRETINSSDDAILRQDMPSALVRVERSAKWLEEASAMLKQDPFSGPARKRLIEGSGGILQVNSVLSAPTRRFRIARTVSEHNPQVLLGNFGPTAVLRRVRGSKDNQGMQQGAGLPGRDGGHRDHGGARAVPARPQPVPEQGLQGSVCQRKGTDASGKERRREVVLVFSTRNFEARKT